MIGFSSFQRAKSPKKARSRGKSANHSAPLQSVNRLASAGIAGQGPIEKRVVGQLSGLKAISVSLFSAAELEAIRQIDQRQNQLLEDLDALNGRILGILKEHGFIAESESSPADGRQFPGPGIAVDGNDELESAA